MMKFKSILFLLLLSFVFTFCKEKPEGYHLTQSEAEARSGLISDVHYKLNVLLTKEDHFSGTVEIRFESNDNKDVRIDYFSGKVNSLLLNNEDLTEKTKPKDGFILIPGNFVSIGKNLVQIRFETPYSRTGNGLHKFTDPDDKEIYIYSQFEAFHANKMFPCFDQPDLKATYQLTVEAPKSWKVISSNLQENISPAASNENSIHTFPQTKKFSTYVFSLHAGPYQFWEDKHDQIPLKLYVRKSLAKYVDPKDWFNFTKEGFTFFESYFGIPYPFEKYDQVIVPEFNFGAMENVGAVTFSERFVHRTTSTRAERENLSDVILHEMAHMWFGDLVTMKWWNGLWLNESFATYMASLAQAKNSEFKETWESFFEKMKQWAYDEDSYSTNHPVEAKVANTEEAFTQFDGITYGKGASVIKQLVFFIGEEAFQRGVHNYLQKYSYSNSSLADFLRELEFASGFPLKKWSKDWLETKGTNEIEFMNICKDQDLIWKIVQSAPGPSNKLRDHKISIGVYSIEYAASDNPEEQKRLAYESFSTVYGGRATASVNKVKTCPNFILVNDEDHDFVVWKWDQFQLEDLKFILTKDKDSFRKLILWTSFYNQILLGKATFEDFYYLSAEVLPKEENIKIKKWVLSKLSSNREHSFFYSRFWYPAPQRNSDLSKLSEFLWNGLNAAKQGSDEQRYWFYSYLESSFHADSQQKLWDIYYGKISIPGLKIAQDLKWSILTKLASLNANREEIDAAVAKEKKVDPSARGLNSSYAIEAGFPDPKSKEKWMNLLLNPKKTDYSSSTLRTVAYYLFPVYQKDLQLPHLESYFSALDQFGSFDDENYIDGFAKILVPNFCTEETKMILKKFHVNHPKLPAAIRKTLMKSIDSETRCLVIRKKHKEKFLPSTSP
ncbi:aminopeptidase N [Leptospira idonii]|nr:aminopeptidase N [Leptospira idonii]